MMRKTLIGAGAAAIAILGGAIWMARDPVTQPLDAQQIRAAQIVNWRYRKVCPAGHLTEIAIGKARIAVELRMLDGISLAPEQPVPTGCPIGAIRAKQILFYALTPELVETYRRHGLRLTRLILADPDRRYGGPAEIPVSPDNRIQIEGIGFIEDITAVGKNPNGPDGKMYRLQPISQTDDHDVPPILMLCAGDPVNGIPKRRNCYTTYTLNGDLIVTYEIRQDHRNDPQEVVGLLPAGPIAEPHDLPAIDARVRAWISEMRRN
jgi:hypothetical protein